MLTLTRLETRTLIGLQAEETARLAIKTKERSGQAAKGELTKTSERLRAHHARLDELIAEL